MENDLETEVGFADVSSGQTSEIEKAKVNYIEVDQVKDSEIWIRIGYENSKESIIQIKDKQVARELYERIGKLL